MSGEVKLTADDLSALRWSKDCNARGVGFLGPTVKRHGLIPEYQVLVLGGLLRCEEDAKITGHRDPDKCGYWITPSGLAVLQGGGK